jgi:hypothetical protein
MAVMIWLATRVAAMIAVMTVAVFTASPSG